MPQIYDQHDAWFCGVVPGLVPSESVKHDALGPLASVGFRLPRLVRSRPWGSVCRDGTEAACFVESRWRLDVGPGISFET